MIKYLAFTIGPIYKTAQKAKRTQALWGASYLFSSLMKEICAALKDKYADNFVTPLVSDERLFEPQKGAGLFPDRLIIKNGEIDDLDEAINSALSNLRKLVHEAVEDKATVDDFIDYLQKYLLLTAIETEAEDSEDVIKKCSKLLSYQEKQPPLMPEEKADLMSEFLENLTKSFLPGEAFGIADARFPSVVEITTEEFARNEETKKYHKQQINEHLFKKGNQDNDELAFLDALKEHTVIKDRFRRYHKYIAIIQADGDNLGKTTETLYRLKPELVVEIGKLLLDFNCEAVDLIDHYGARPVFLGGDDLLIFSPIRCGKTSVFDLMKALNALYKQKVDDFFDAHKEILAGIFPRPTLSFGVSISYYKFPMHEAIKIASDLLEKIKKEKEGKKNSLAFRVSKHSGQYFETQLLQSGPTYEEDFKTIVGLRLENQDAFLTSVIFEMRESKHIIEAILQADYPQERLTNYFENSFNEEIHRSDKKKFIDATAALLYQLFDENDHNTERAIQTTYSVLRLAQFLNQKDLQNDERE